MAINFNSALGNYEAALKLRTKRAEVLSSNLANADTPNYKARDFDFNKALAAYSPGGNSSSGLRATHGAHMSLGGDQSLDLPLEYRVPTQPSVDGNTVDEHKEHAEFMSNSLEFQVAFTLLNSRFKGLSSAIKGE